MSENFDILNVAYISTFFEEGMFSIMRKQFINMQTLINNNKEEILTNKKEIARIEKLIDEKLNKQLQASTKH